MYVIEQLTNIFSTRYYSELVVHAREFSAPLSRGHCRWGRHCINQCDVINQLKR